MKIQYLFFIIGIQVLLSCGSSNANQDKIVGSWTFVKVDAGVWNAGLNHAQKQNINLMEQTMKDMRYKFFENESFLMDAGGNDGMKANGKYRLIEDGRAIELSKEGANTKPKVMNLEKLTNDSLILEENGVRLYFVKGS
jgi:hypothetical protein